MVDFIRAIHTLHQYPVEEELEGHPGSIPGGLHLLTALPPPPYASTNGRDASYPQLKISCHISSHGKLGYPIKSTQKRTDSVLLSILKDSVLRCTTSYYIPPLVATNGRCIYQTSVYLRTVNTLLWYSRTLTYPHLGRSERCHLHITQMRLSQHFWNPTIRWCIIIFPTNKKQNMFPSKKTSTTINIYIFILYYKPYFGFHHVDAMRMGALPSEGLSRWDPASPRLWCFLDHPNPRIEGQRSKTSRAIEKVGLQHGSTIKSWLFYHQLLGIKQV